MLLWLLVGAVALVFVVAITTSGQAWEEVLVRLGFRFKREWPLTLLGVVTYLGLFLALPIFIGLRFFGIAGAILLPIVILVIMALLDRW